MIKFKGDSKDFYDSIRVILSGEADLSLEELEAYLQLLRENLDGVAGLIEVAGSGFIENYPEEFSEALQGVEYDELVRLCARKKDYPKDLREFLQENSKYANIEEYKRAERILKLREELISMYCLLSR